MAKFVATDYNITINGTPFSASLAAVTLDITAEEQDTTSFGSTYRTRIGGLKDASVSFDFMQDFGASSIDATLFPLLGTNATVVIKPTSTAVSASNPAYTAICVVNDLTPVSGNIGDLATFSVTWPTTGTISRATA